MYFYPQDDTEKSTQDGQIQVSVLVLLSQSRVDSVFGASLSSCLPSLVEIESSVLQFINLVILVVKKINILACSLPA